MPSIKTFGIFIVKVYAALFIVAMARKYIAPLDSALSQIGL